MRPSITVRRPRFDLSGLLRDWVGGSRWATHFGNAGHVFIPLGEQFFIDAVRAHREALGDRDELRQAGFAFASGLLAVVPTVGIVLFALADRRPTARPGRDALRLAGMSARLARRMAGHLVGYLAPGFHPGDLSVPSEAERWERELEAPAA